MISIVVPFYNEQENVSTLVKSIVEAVKNIKDCELICVDDFSRDKTLQILQQCQPSQSMPIRILSHTKNYGQSAALWTGVSYAQYDWIVTLDGDGQNPPEGILTLIKCWREYSENQKPDLICGIRQKRQDSSIKRWSSKIANSIRKKILKDGIEDTGCGLKMFRRDLFLKLPYFDHMHRYYPALFLRQGGKIVTVPVNHRPRQAGQSKYGTWDRLKVGMVDLFGVYWLSKRAHIPRAIEIPEVDKQHG